uniref:Inhibitor of nuclear factor kappa B kinase subunit epsilon n=1 Tax=Myotis lucifugus TaxID=59463 RepID=G1NYM5_MYOLU
MQSTANYLWHTDDLLGQGATASVYKARNKKSGELVAVKVFNAASYLRPREVQVREFEVLRKLNHQNIVKLFAVEETVGAVPGQRTVLTLTFAGWEESGHTLIEAWSRAQQQGSQSRYHFLNTLSITCIHFESIKLHKNLCKDNTRRQWKGSAGRAQPPRALSLHGRPLVLRQHPDMYERAVLRKPQQKSFGVTVDLWSIGVTLYHAATGSLPFIPFGGPRRNKEIMYRITTEKPSGAIAGTQRQENGPLEWSYALPITCQLSMGLQSQLVPVLANILEVEPAKCWGFDQFFAETSDILQRVIVHVFSLPQAVLHHVYIHAHNTIAIFLEVVYEQTSVAPQNQEYLFEGHLCVLEPSLSAQHIAHTTASPLTLCSVATEIPRAWPLRTLALHVDSCIFIDSAYSDPLQSLFIAVLSHVTMWVTRGLFKLVPLPQPQDSPDTPQASVLSQGCHAPNASFSVLPSRFSNMAGMPEVQELKRAAELRSQLRTLAEVLSLFSHNVTEKQTILSSLSSELAKSRDQVHEDRSIQQIQCCLDKMYLIYKQFRKTRMRPGLGYNEEQIHKLDKVNFSHLAKRLLQVFQEECVQKYRASLVTHGERMRVVHEARNHLRLVACSVAAYSTEAQKVQEGLSKILDWLSLQLLQDRAKGAQVPPTPTAPYSSPAPKDLGLHMEELCKEMKLLASDLQDNNCIIERLSRVQSAADV